MNTLEKLEKFLFNNDGMPNQDLIDYKVDQMVEKMIQELLYGKKEASGAGEPSLVDDEKNINIVSSLEFRARQKFFNLLHNQVKKSVKRYYPYIQLASQEDIEQQVYSHKKDEDDVIIYIHFPTKMIITPEMKKTFPMKNKLEQELSEKNMSPIKSKI